MTTLYSAPLFLEHQTGRSHPERPERLIQVTRHLERLGLDCAASDTPGSRPRSSSWRSCTTATIRPKLRPFAAPVAGAWKRIPFVAQILRCRPAGRRRRVRRGRADARRRRSHRLVPRPSPRPSRARRSRDGFLPVQQHRRRRQLAIRQFQLDRVLVVDWDVHHGNGTQDMFWDDRRSASSPCIAGRFIPEVRGRRDRRLAPSGTKRTSRRNWHAAQRDPRSFPSRVRAAGRGRSGRNWSRSAPASTPTATTRSGRSAWKSRISRL